jgi:hypothetical protein
MLVVKEPGVYVQRDRRTRSPIVLHLDAGTRVLVTARCGHQWQVQRNGVSGWVSDLHVDGPRPETVPEDCTLPTPPPTLTPGGPVRLVSPYVWFYVRERLQDTVEWEGYLGILYEGGSEPFLFAVNDNPPQDQNYLYVRWTICRALPLTLHVWSADGSEAIERMQLPGWCP